MSARRTTLTVILQINELSGEFINLIKACQESLNPESIIVNTNDNEVIDYFVRYYRKDHYHVTVTDFESLEQLIDQISKNYRTDFYLALNTVSPDLDEEYLPVLFSEFKNAKKRYGLAVNIIPQTDLICEGTLPNQPIGIINRKLLFENHSVQAKQSYHYLMIPEKLEHLPVIKLQSKTVMITGVLGGIGQAMAKKYFEEGWRVVGLDRSEKKDLDPSQIVHCHQYYDLDLSRIKTVQSRIKEILDRVPKLDSLVHVAGYQICGPITDRSAASRDWDDVFNVNLRSIYTISREAFEHLQRSKGNIVVIGSVHAFASSRDISAYAITKAALLGLVRNFAIEWGQNEIRVNGIAPGAIKTKMLMDGLGRRGDDPEEQLKILASRHLMKKVGAPEDIANLSFFLSDNQECPFLTGQTIVADGGASLVLSTEIG